MIKIIPAYSGEALEHAVMISQRYVDWMLDEIQVNYPELDIAEFKSEHEYDDVRDKFPGEHIPPHGNLLVAMNDGQPAGCIALGKLSETICELRALYVLPEFRGLGIGRELVEAILHDAKNRGYLYARLDTLRFMEGALNLYRSFGFYEIEPYLEMSESLKQYIRFLEFKLSDID